MGGVYPEGFAMRPVKRSFVKKSSGARQFRSHVARTRAPNVVQAPMRGGWRL